MGTAVDSENHIRDDRKMVVLLQVLLSLSEASRHT
jgi:hypothetical protein